MYRYLMRSPSNQDSITQIEADGYTVEFGYDSETELYVVRIMNGLRQLASGKGMFVDAAVSAALHDFGWMRAA